MEENKNTFAFKKNITTEEKHAFIPSTGDKLVICSDEDAALSAHKSNIREWNAREALAVASYKNHNEEESIDFNKAPGEVFLTDFFKLPEVGGTVCAPVYIGEKKFGFFGCRVNAHTGLNMGYFYLYETE